MYSKQNTFIVADFDDTIFAREEQLEKEKLLRENRWDAGTKIMIENLWIDYMMENYYENNTFPKEILYEILVNNWIVLTAWNNQLQLAKQKATKLENIEYTISNINYHYFIKYIEDLKYLLNKNKHLFE